MRLLLPLVLAVVAAFLVALPFTGLAPLWGTGNGTALLMALNALALFFVNAAYQTGEKSPYPPSIHARHRHRDRAFAHRLGAGIVRSLSAHRSIWLDRRAFMGA